MKGSTDLVHIIILPSTHPPPPGCQESRCEDATPTQRERGWEGLGGVCKGCCFELNTRKPTSLDIILDNSVSLFWNGRGSRGKANADERGRGVDEREREREREIERRRISSDQRTGSKRERAMMGRDGRARESNRVWLWCLD